MQLFSKFRRVAPIVAIIALALVSSCNSSKKYGCPNHLFTPTIVTDLVK